MGEGQEAVVETCLDTAQHIGGYVLLEDIHLVPAHWFGRLQELLAKLKTLSSADPHSQGICLSLILLNDRKHNL